MGFSSSPCQIKTIHNKNKMNTKIEDLNLLTNPRNILIIDNPEKTTTNKTIQNLLDVEIPVTVIFDYQSGNLYSKTINEHYLKTTIPDFDNSAEEVSRDLFILSGHSLSAKLINKDCFMDRLAKMLEERIKCLPLQYFVIDKISSVGNEALYAWLERILKSGAKSGVYTIFSFQVDDEISLPIRNNCELILGTEDLSLQSHSHRVCQNDMHITV